MRLNSAQRHLLSVTIKSALTSIFAVAVLIGVGGLFYRQHTYLQHHLPLIRAGVATADRQGAAILEDIGLPPGTTASQPASERRLVFGDSRSMWQGEPVGIAWARLWDAPGDHSQIDTWYHDKLLASDWQLFQPNVPSAVQTEYWKDKWLLAIEHEASFATDRPPHARFRLRLTWDYWHSFHQ